MHVTYFLGGSGMWDKVCQVSKLAKNSVTYFRNRNRNLKTSKAVLKS